MAVKKKLDKGGSVVDPIPLSNLMEMLLEEIAEGVMDSMVDEGYLAPVITDDDTNTGTDLLCAIEDELRKCIRG